MSFSNACLFEKEEDRLMKRKELKIGILSVATGKYIDFLEPLYESIEHRFLSGYKKTYFVFTDNPKAVQTIAANVGVDALSIPIERQGFPGDTLLRYNYFSRLPAALAEVGSEPPDVLFYLDADMLVFFPVGPEVLPVPPHSELVATSHPGYYKNRTPTHPLGDPDQNPKSRAYIRSYEAGGDHRRRKRICYLAGGFNGGTYSAFMKMCEVLSKQIADDLADGVMAKWHDESHLNEYCSRYYIFERLKILTPEYCFDQKDMEIDGNDIRIKGVQYAPRIVALDKDHNKVRS